MAVTLVQNTVCRRTITPGSIFLSLGKATTKCPPPIAKCDIYYTPGAPVGFFCAKETDESIACFVIEKPPGTISFFNVGHVEDDECETT